MSRKSQDSKYLMGISTSPVVWPGIGFTEEVRWKRTSPGGRWALAPPATLTCHHFAPKWNAVVKFVEHKKDVSHRAGNEDSEDAYDHEAMLDASGVR
jgi:hypothetical protein